jgi:small ligand-binding sensory domain FIST
MTLGTRPAFRLGHAAHSDWKTATEQALKSLGEKGADGVPVGTLGFIYMTDAFSPYAADMLALIKNRTGIADWVGSVGIGIVATGTEYLDEPAVALMTCALPSGSHAVFSGNARPPKPGTLTPSGADAAWFAVVHADPHTPDIDELIRDMAGKVTSGYLAGGLSSARGATLQIANEVVVGGISGVVFSSDVAVGTRLTQGCSPLPNHHTMTQVDRNILVTLDHRPALDVMLEDLKCDIKGLRGAARDTFIGLVVPGAEASGGGGDYLVRNLVGIDPTNKLVAVGDMPEQGAAMMFCRRDAQTARDDLLKMIYDLKDDLTEPPRAALYHACVGRGPNMFGEQGAEMRLIREHLGDIPLVGFFANGEIARDRLYGFTGVLTIFK